MLVAFWSTAGIHLILIDIKYRTKTGREVTKIGVQYLGVRWTENVDVVYLNQGSQRRSSIPVWDIVSISFDGLIHWPSNDDDFYVVAFKIYNFLRGQLETPTATPAMFNHHMADDQLCDHDCACPKLEVRRNSQGGLEAIVRADAPRQRGKWRTSISLNTRLATAFGLVCLIALVYPLF